MADSIPSLRRKLDEMTADRDAWREKAMAANDPAPIPRPVREVVVREVYVTDPALIDTVKALQAEVCRLSQ